MKTRTCRIVLLAFLLIALAVHCGGTSTHKDADADAPADDSVVLTYDTIEAEGAPLAAVLEPGEGAGTEYIVHHPAVTAGDCEHAVYIELSIDYLVNGSPAPTLKLHSLQVHHSCVS